MPKFRAPQSAKRWATKFYFQKAELDSIFSSTLKLLTKLSFLKATSNPLTRFFCRLTPLAWRHMECPYRWGGLSPSEKFSFLVQSTCFLTCPASPAPAFQNALCLIAHRVLTLFLFLFWDKVVAFICKTVIYYINILQRKVFQMFICIITWSTKWEKWMYSCFWREE